MLVCLKLVYVIVAVVFSIESLDFTPKNTGTSD